MPRLDRRLFARQLFKEIERWKTLGLISDVQATKLRGLYDRFRGTSSEGQPRFEQETARLGSSQSWNVGPVLYGAASVLVGAAAIAFLASFGVLDDRGLGLFVSGGVLWAIGLAVRFSSENRRYGDALIAGGLVPAALASVPEYTGSEVWAILTVLIACLFLLTLRKSSFVPALATAAYVVAGIGLATSLDGESFGSWHYWWLGLQTLYLLLLGGFTQAEGRFTGLLGLFALGTIPAGFVAWSDSDPQGILLVVSGVSLLPAGVMLHRQGRPNWGDGLLLASLIPLVGVGFNIADWSTAWAPIPLVVTLAIHYLRGQRSAVAAGAMLGYTLGGLGFASTYTAGDGLAHAATWLSLQGVGVLAYLALGLDSRGRDHVLPGTFAAGGLAAALFVLFGELGLSSLTLASLLAFTMGLLLMAASLVRQSGLAGGAALFMGLSVIVLAFDVDVALGMLVLLAAAGVLIWQAESLRALVKRGTPGRNA